MPSAVALYYPFIHFRDDGWIKTSALYWDSVKRIVPDGIELRDSDDVKALRVVGFVQDVSPTSALATVDALFSALLDSYGDRLTQALGVENRSSWSDNSYTLFHAPEGADPKLAYVFGGKMTPQLLSTFHARGLIASRTDDPRWIGMHPLLAAVYMTALAECLASTLGAHPITDDARDHIAICGGTIERVAAVLLDEVTPPEHHAPDLEQIMVTLALKNVVPDDASNVPISQIVHLHEQLAEDRGLFQAEVARLVANVAHLRDVSSLDEVGRQIAAEYEKALRPRIERLEEELSHRGIRTLDSVLATSFALPSGVAFASGAMGVAATTAASAAFGIWTLWRKNQQERSTALSPSPEAYLYRIDKALTPASTAVGIRSIIERLRGR